MNFLQNYLFVHTDLLLYSAWTRFIFIYLCLLLWKAIFRSRLSFLLIFREKNTYFISIFVCMFFFHFSVLKSLLISKVSKLFCSEHKPAIDLIMRWKDASSYLRKSTGWHPSPQARCWLLQWFFWRVVRMPWVIRWSSGWQHCRRFLACFLCVFPASPPDL